MTIGWSVCGSGRRGRGRYCTTIHPRPRPTASRGQRSRLPELSRPLPRLDLTALRCHPEFPESSRSKKRETGRIGREQETKGELRFRQQVIITTEMKYVCQDLAEVDKLFGICAASAAAGRTEPEDTLWGVTRTCGMRSSSLSVKKRRR